MLQRETTLRGHSGAVLEVLPSRQFVVKYSESPRLLKQAELQRQFHTHVPNLKAVPVVGVSSEARGLHHHLVMPFIEGVCPLHHEKPMLDTILAFIDESMTKSELVNVDGKIFSLKLNDIEQRCSQMRILPEGWKRPWLECRAELAGGLWQAPLGPCHGDLTFTNMLQRDHELFLFDFLDNVIDSPLFDMVKLRQDTAHGWVNLLYPDAVVHEATLAKVDRVLQAEFIRYESYRHYYRALQQFNLLRILPYCAERHVALHVVRELEAL